MATPEVTFTQASDLLEAAAHAIDETLTAIGNPDYFLVSRQGFITNAHLLAVWVADADGQLLPKELTAINNIFWLERWLPDCWTVRDQPQDPDQAEASIGMLELAVDLVATSSADAYPLSQAVETILQTVLAADGGDAPELARLNQVTTRLRAAFLKATTPSPAPEAGSTVVAQAPAPAPVPAPDLTTLLAQLDALVGLASVKHEVETLVNLAKVFALRKQMNMAVPPMSFHLLFLGNPGTGKTTVARIVAQLYGALGLLQKGQLVEVDRSGLVAQYLGQTATKTEAVITSALGGVLFIDEAYALADGGPQDYGQEAIATLIKGMEDHRDELVVIAAGYTDQMHKFIAMNPGLRSRMSREIAFDDYSPPEMVAIFRSMAKTADYLLPADCDPTLTATFQQLWDQRSTNFANARDVRNLFEAVVDAQACRVAALPNPTADDLRAITAADLATCTPGAQ